MPTNIVSSPQGRSSQSPFAEKYDSTPRAPRPALRAIDPQMRIDVAHANESFLASLKTEARHKAHAHSPSHTNGSPRRSASPSKRSAAPREKLHLERPFSLDGVPTLDEFVAVEHLPEELLVFDRGDVTGRRARRPESALRYVRAYSRAFNGPARMRAEGAPSATMRRGYLFLDRENQVADGRRSAVHRAPLMATLGPKGGTPKRVAVVAKTAKANCRSHYLLRNEGRAYSTMPLALSGRFGPAPSSSTPPTDVDAAVIPRFYGLYIPVDSQGKKLCGCHQECDGYIHADCPVDWATPILLMEDCGAPVDLGRMKKAERKQCWSLVDRLHESGVAHGSAHPRNILVQPGPFSLPRSERSMATPSFRIASFGRTEVLWPRPGPPTRLAVHSFQKVREQDVQTALSALCLWEEDK